MSFENRWSCVKYEKMEENVEYSISLNPADEWQCWTSDNRMEAFQTMHVNYLRRLAVTDKSHVCMFKLFIEVSPNGRLHFHGKLKVLNKKLFYLYAIHKLQARYTYEIDVLNDDEIWYAYCSKQELSSEISVGFDFKKMVKDFYSKQPVLTDKY